VLESFFFMEDSGVEDYVPQPGQSYIDLGRPSAARQACGVKCPLSLRPVFPRLFESDDTITSNFFHCLV